MSNTTTGSFSPANMTKYRKKGQDFLRTKLFLHRSALKATIDKNNGANVRAYRVDTLAAATSALTEGAAPSETSMTGTNFTATLLQYGAYCKQTDLLETVGPSDEVEQFSRIFGYQGALSIDTLVLNEYIASAQAYYANNLDAGTFDASGVFSSKEVRRMTKRFRAKKCMGFLEDDLFRLYIHPDCEFDIVTDDTFGSLTDLQKRDPDPEKWKNVAAVYGGTAIFVTPLIDTTSVNGVTAYRNIGVSYGALLAYDLQGLPFRLYVNPSSNISISNPLAQLGSVGWKATFVADYIGSDGPRAHLIYAAATEPTA